jgi:hypothetical protein
MRNIRGIFMQNRLNNHSFNLGVYRFAIVGLLIGLTTCISVFGQQSNWEGTWTFASRYSPATLKIKKLSASKFKFTIEAISGTHDGEISGIATVKGNRASFSDGNKKKDENCRLIFTKKTNSILVDEENCSSYGGVGVGFGLEYSKGKGKLIEQSFVAIEVFPNAEIDRKFKTLVGSKDYESFLNSFQMAGEDEDKDNLGAKVFSGCVRGICPYNAAIIMFDKNENLWAAVIEAGENKSTIKYYSNVGEWADKMPKTIEEWVNDKRGLNENLEIVFKNKR